MYWRRWPFATFLLIHRPNVKHCGDNVGCSSITVFNVCQLLYTIKIRPCLLPGTIINISSVTSTRQVRETLQLEPPFFLCIEDKTWTAPQDNICIYKRYHVQIFKCIGHVNMSLQPIGFHLVPTFLFQSYSCSAYGMVKAALNTFSATLATGIAPGFPSRPSLYIRKIIISFP